jgi:hypothetical protein
MSFTRKEELGITEPSIAGLLRKLRANNASEDNAGDNDRAADFLAA